MKIVYKFGKWNYEYEVGWLDVQSALKDIITKEFEIDKHDGVSQKLLNFIVEDLGVSDERWLEIYETELYDYFYKDAKCDYSYV